MVADDCRGVEAMLCGVDVSANDVGSIGLDGGRQVAWAVDLAEARLSLAAARMLAQTGTQLGVGDWGWLAAESLHMQHAGANARRAGVGLRHVAGETALWTGGGRGCGEYCGDDGDDGGVEVLRGCCAVPCCAVLCCAVLLAQESGRVCSTPRAGQEDCAAEGEAWQRLARVAVERAVGEGIEMLGKRRRKRIMMMMMMMTITAERQRGCVDGDVTGKESLWRECCSGRRGSGQSLRGLGVVCGVPRAWRGREKRRGSCLELRHHRLTT